MNKTHTSSFWQDYEAGTSYRVNSSYRSPHMTLCCMALSCHFKIYTCWTAVPQLIHELCPAGVLEGWGLGFQKVGLNLAMPLSPSSYLFQMFPLERVELHLPAALGFPDEVIACGLVALVLFFFFCFYLFRVFFSGYCSAALHTAQWQAASLCKLGRACKWGCDSEWSSRLAFPNH